MSHQDKPPEDTGNITFPFAADFFGELVTSAAGSAEVRGVNGLPSGPALIVVKRGPNAGSRFLLNRPVTSAGRHPNSDIFLDEVTVSRQHAEFRRESGELCIVDVDSLNGTYVNGKSVQSAVLTNGDEIQIGKFRLVFLTGHPARAADRSTQSTTAAR
ncbi:FHA domain-containing protein [Mycobacterium sp.]|uniref:FHA domain-containing protein n=1 Tax=Mycobacterium sp. TaxID=1785 RepID=UPI003D6B13AA